MAPRKILSGTKRKPDSGPLMVVTTIKNSPVPAWVLAKSPECVQIVNCEQE